VERKGKGKYADELGTSACIPKSMTKLEGLIKRRGGVG
jgi:hypothetical protein